MSMVSETLHAFLQARKTPANADLVDRWSRAMETQVNVAQGNGEPVAGKRNTWSNENGTDIWHPIRIPHDADSEPHWRDYPAPYLLSEHAEGIGMTGWDWQARRSRRFGFDFDALLGHAKKGLADAELDRVRQAATQLPYVEVRRSTGGIGLHLWACCTAAGIPCENHTVHAAIARCILEMMSRDCHFDFTSQVDCAGGNMWIWHRKMTAANQGLALIKTATQLLSEADLPADWRDHIQVRKRKKEAAPSAKPAVDDDFCRTSDFGFLADRGWEKSGDNFRRPGTDKPISASIVTAEDGTRLLHVFSSNAQPFEADKNYNAFDAYKLLNHAGDSEAARAALARQGYGGRIWIKMLSCAELADHVSDTRFLVKKTLVAGQPCMIAGPKKALKTSITVDLVISLVTGSPFLGQLEVLERCKVAILSGESGLDTLRATAERVSASKGFSLRDIPDLYWSDFLPTFSEVRHLDAVNRMVKDVGCRVLVIDPTYMCMSGSDPSNLFAQGPLLRAVNEVCRENDAGLILLHHTRKRGKMRNRNDYEPPELDDMAYAGFAEFARQWFLIGRREDYTCAGEHELWLSVGGSAGHSKLWALDVDEVMVDDMPTGWTVALSTPNEARSAKKAGNMRQRLLDAAAEFPAGETKSVLFKVAGLRSGGNSQLVLDALVQEKLLVAHLVTKSNGLEYPGYRLAEVKA